MCAGHIRQLKQLWEKQPGLFIYCSVGLGRDHTLFPAGSQHSHLAKEQSNNVSGIGLRKDV